MLSIWWAFGQLVGSLVAWPLIANFSCADAKNCPKSSNMGWRYFLYTMGGLMMVMFILRFFVFHLHESPKYLMGRGRDEEAVEVLQAIAKYNGTTTRLAVDLLKEAEHEAAVKEDSKEEDVAPVMDTSAKAAITRKLNMFSLEHVRPLFATKKLAYSTTLLIIIWAFIGLAFPLYNGFVTYL